MDININDRTSYVRRVNYNKNNSGFITIPRSWLIKHNEPSNVIISLKDDKVIIEVFKEVV